MIHKFYYKFRVTFIFAISTFFVLSLHFPSQYFISSAHAVLPVIALTAAENAALFAGRILLLNGSRVAGTSLASQGAANGSIYATAAANGQIYGTVAANASEFIAPSIATTAGVAATGGSTGYLSAAALGLISLTGAAAYYTTRDGEKIDISGANNKAVNPLDIADSPVLSELSPDDRNFDEMRNNQQLAETGDPDTSRPQSIPKYKYHLNGTPSATFPSASEACSHIQEFWNYFNPKSTCSGKCELRSPRTVGLACRYMQACPKQCSEPVDMSLELNPRRDLAVSIVAVALPPEKKCRAGTMLNGDSSGCGADYSKDPVFYPPSKYPSTPEYENRPGSGITPHPEITPAMDPKNLELPIGNTDNPDATVKARNNPDGSLQLLADIKGILLDINVKLDRIQAGQTEIINAIERRITGAQLKQEEDASKEPITIVNNTYYDVAGNEYNVTYIVRDNPGANPKPITPGDKIILPNGTVIQPNYDPTDFPKDDVQTTTKTQPVPDPNPTPNPNPNPNPDPNPAPSPVQDVVTKTKIDPRTGDIVEETTKTTPLPDGSKKIEITVQIQPDPKSNPDPTPATEPTPEPTKFTWECGIDGKPPCQVTQDVGKLADSDWSDVDVPPANYTEQLKDKLFGKLFDNFKFTPPTSSVCPTVTVDFTSISFASNIRIFSQPFVLDYHCKNLFEPLYEQFRALFQLGWFLMALYIVLSA